MSYLSDRQYGLLSHRRLLVKLKNSSSITRRLNLDCTLNFHRGCVNTIWWNDQGTTILSGSDDQNLIVTDPYTRQVLTKVHSGHRENIFSAKFLPETNDQRVVSCSGDGIIFHTDFARPNSLHSTDGCFRCHGSSTAYEVRVIPHTPNLFLSCSDDRTVRLFDLRAKSNCLKEHCKEDVLIKSKWGITSIDINPMNSNEIVCACSDSTVRLYDHRKLSSQVSLNPSVAGQCEASIDGLLSYFILSDRKESRRSRITSVVFNQYGTEILASYSSESVYLLDPKQSLSQEQSKQRLIEHRNQKRTKADSHENKATSTSAPSTETKPPSVKRLRLRGDWSDTGPDSRPSNEDEQVASPSESSNEQQPSAESGRNLENFFMQRMSDILTQLVTTTTTSETEGAETPATSNNIVDDPVTSSPSTPAPNTTSTTTDDNDDDDEDESGRNGILDLIFGRYHRFQPEEDSEDDNSNDDDDENSHVSSSDVQSPGNTRRRFIPTRRDRLRKHRESERSHEENLLKNIPSPGLLNSYDGHRNARTMIKEANFWSDSYVMSGSDCGISLNRHIFIWNKFTGKIVRIIPADGHVVNCVQPHPLNYPILASSGIDYNIKIFSPSAEKTIDDSERIDRTVKRNHAMIEETSSTITVPPNFMFRMLASIYRLRYPDEMSGHDDNDESTE